VKRRCVHRHGAGATVNEPRRGRHPLSAFRTLTRGVTDVSRALWRSDFTIAPDPGSIGLS
jgi:hypothetical protein